MTDRKKRHPEGSHSGAHARALSECDDSGRTRYFKCKGCGQNRPLQSYFEGQPSYKQEDRPALCNLCGRRGRNLPEVVNDCDTLTVSHRKAIRVLLQPTNNSVKEAAQASGLSERKISDLMSGRGKKEFRQAFHLALHGQGLSFEQLAENLAHSALHAVKRQWNPAEQCWDEAPDESVRFQATRHALKLLEMEPRESKQGGMGGAVIILSHNLGGAAEKDADPPGTYTITAEDPEAS